MEPEMVCEEITEAGVRPAQSQITSGLLKFKCFSLYPQVGFSAIFLSLGLFCKLGFTRLDLASFPRTWDRFPMLQNLLGHPACLLTTWNSFVKCASQFRLSYIILILFLDCSKVIASPSMEASGYIVFLGIPGASVCAHR